MLLTSISKDVLQHLSLQLLILGVMLFGWWDSWNDTLLSYAIKTGQLCQHTAIVRISQGAPFLEAVPKSNTQLLAEVCLARLFDVSDTFARALLSCEA